ncbi:MAG: SDR family oxidoreductase [Candidatus Moranbacteria bacterium]|nr:SDR family oxidoreductase [Candidatus Moranbacteria bacterium]
MKFEDKIVLVTGGGRGIGAETAKNFAREGATVIINYVSDEDSAKKVLDDIDGKGEIVKADVSDEAQVDEMFEKIEKSYSKIDILVNSAGIVSPKSFAELSVGDWRKTHAVNLDSVFLCCKKAVPLMNSGGSIVNVASIRGLFDQGRPGVIDYSSSKAAVISFTKTLAKEVAPDIRVNSVSPGVTNTDIAKGFSKELLEKFVDDIYLRRIIEPQEVADAILFLSSKEASAITGVNLMVDGGQSLGK